MKERFLVAPLVLGLLGCGTILSLEGDDTPEPSSERDGSPSERDASPGDALASGDGTSDAPEGAVPVQHLVVFVSRATFLPSATSVAGADDLCDLEAKTADAGARARAWLSTSTSDAIGRLPPDADWSMPMLATSSLLAFPSRDYIAAGGTPKVALDRDSTGLVVLPTIGEERVWTGTGAMGQRTASTCSDWRMLSSRGTTGLIGSVTQWTDDGAGQPCSSTFHLLCFGY